MKRYDNLDVLRIIACLMVVVSHVATPYRNDYQLVNEFYYIGHFYDGITRFCVPLFVMLAGTFSMKITHSLTYKRQSIKVWKKFIIPLIKWSIIYIVFTILIGFIKNNFDIKQLILSIITGRPSPHLWYMSMIIPLYIGLPLLLKIKIKLSKKQYILLAVVMVVFGWLVNINWKILGPLSLLDYLKGIMYIGYFLLGNVIFEFFDKYKISRKSKIVINTVMIVLFISSCILIYTLTNQRVELGIENPFKYYNNLSIFNILGTISLFILFSNLEIKLNNYSRKIVLYAGVIYFVHQLFVDSIYEIILAVTGEYLTFNPIWFIPLMTIIVFALSFLFAEYSQVLMTNLKGRNEEKIVVLKNSFVD